MIKVAIGGIHFPLSMMSYFIRAFKRRDDVELFLFGPYTGDWIPWANGIRIPQKYVVVPDFVLPKEAIGFNIPSGMIQFPWIPDLTLLIDAGWHTADRPKGNIVAHVQTDPHVLKHTYTVPKAYSDISFCMQEAYMIEGEHYLPYGFDREVFYPQDKEKIHDACLIGLHYDHRTQLVNRLRQLGLNVFYDIGLIYDEFREKYNESKVSLSWSSMQDLPCRVWEGFGMGLPSVINRVPDLSNFFVEGEHYLGFDNTDEAVKQVLTLLTDEDTATEIGYNAYRKVINAHTFDHRVQQILETVKLV